MNRIVIAALLSLVLLVPSLAPSFAHDGEHHEFNLDSFKIQSFGIDIGGNPYLTVEDMAGTSVPGHDDTIYAYVFVTDAGIYAVTSHMGDDTPHEHEEELEWHSHSVELDENGCVTSITEDGESQMATNRVTVLDTDATSVSQVMTVELTASDAGTCVTDVFDESHKSKGPKKDIGVLLYTHGDMMNHHGTPNHDRMMVIETMVENKFKTPTEVIYHMPYNWDAGLAALDGDVKYAVFMYTDMFGPDSTVIHNVTRGVFGGIEEYNYCPGFISPTTGLCNYMGQATVPASAVSDDVVIVFAEPARPDHPVLRNIFLEQAEAVSENPRNEILVFVGHGARSNANDNAMKEEMANAAAYVEKKMKFADSLAVTAREDWPDLKAVAVANAVSQIEKMLEETGAVRVVLVPATGSGSGFDAVAEALEGAGIDFVGAPESNGEEEFEKWAQQVMRETVNFIKKEKPTEATITPYWNREY